MLTLSRKAQEIYAQLDQLNTHHHNVDAKLRRLRSDVNLSGIFVRDYLLDVAREHAPEYRERLAEFREATWRRSRNCVLLDATHAERITQSGGATRRILADVRAAVRLDGDRKDLSQRALSCGRRSCPGARRSWRSRRRSRS